MTFTKGGQRKKITECEHSTKLMNLGGQTTVIPQLQKIGFKLKLKTKA